MLKDVPLPAKVLGLAGLIPFLAGAVGVWVLPELIAAIAMTWQLAYGAVILTFVGAVHWGYAMRDEEMRWGRMTWSVTPALVAWIGLLLTPLMTALILFLSFVMAFMTDTRAVRAGLFPAWYLGLRKALTLGVLVSLAATLARIWASMP